MFGLILLASAPELYSPAAHYKPSDDYIGQVQLSGDLYDECLRNVANRAFKEKLSMAQAEERGFHECATEFTVFERAVRLMVNADGNGSEAEVQRQLDLRRGNFRVIVDRVYEFLTTWNN